MAAIVISSIIYLVLGIVFYDMIMGYLRVDGSKKVIKSASVGRQRRNAHNKKGDKSSSKRRTTSAGNVISDEQEKTIGTTIFIIVMIVGFLARILTAFILVVAKNYKGYEVDMNCFFAWADMAFKDGLKNFYSSESFTDYPPGYVYILYVIGGIRHTFSIDQGSATSVILTKMPAMLSDMGIAYIIYLFSKEKIKERGGAILAGLFLFCPIIFLDSTIWGQTDSVFMVCIVAMCYLIYKKKLIRSYFVYALSILIKPQALMFAPIILLAFANEIIENRNENLVNKKDTNAFLTRLGIHLGSGLLAIGSIFLFMVPYGVSYALKQYTSTVSSYPYASVNAYNFWALIGKNWVSQDTVFLGLPCKTWGSAAIVLTVIFVSIMFFKSQNSKSRYAFVGAFTIIMVFALSVRMHERYMYPVVAFLLIAFALRPLKRIFILFMMSATAVFFNAAHVLFYYDPQNYDANNPMFKVTGLMVLACFAYAVYVGVTLYLKPEKEETEKELYTKKRINQFTIIELLLHLMRRMAREVIASEKPAKMTKMDFILMAVITLVYACVAFTNLGNKKGPETDYSFVNQGAITVDLGEEKSVAKLWDFLGYQNNPTYLVDYSTDGQSYTALYTEDAPWDAGSVFKWNSTDVNIMARYIRITPSSTNYKDSMIEIAFTDSDGNVFTPVNAEDYHNLFDEQEYVVTRATNLNGTYFDEIYHARTAYEIIHKLYCYENTHPPLGKEFIALGVLIFGMTPFGWRFMGTLFGVFMVMVMYNFAKKFFKSTEFAVIATLLFSFDFMHFVQTRIATIDVFVVLFIMLSYYFMYLYTRMSFYNTPLKKTFIVLALCGITMGMGIASKWTGIYSAAGLAVIIFIQFFRRINEYIYASKNPSGETNGIKHEDIIKKFKPNMLATIGFCCIVFLVVPAIIYCLSYIPFNDGVADRTFFQKVIEAQKTMYNYHKNLKAEHPYSSTWYQWPIMYRPMWYYSGVASDTLREGISAFGNPLVWWAGIPATVYMLYLWILKRERKAGFLILAYLAQYAPWFLVSRVVFIYHYFPSVPFITIMVAYMLMNFTKFKFFAGKANAEVTDGKKKFKFKSNYLVWLYVAIAIVLFIMFYPVLSGTPVDVGYVEKWLKWSDNWVLVQTW